MKNYKVTRYRSKGLFRLYLSPFSRALRKLAQSYGWSIEAIGEISLIFLSCSSLACFPENKIKGVLAASLAKM